MAHLALFGSLLPTPRAVGWREPYAEGWREDLWDGAALGMGVGWRARSFDCDATFEKRTPSLPT